MATTSKWIPVKIISTHIQVLETSKIWLFEEKIRPNDLDSDTPILVRDLNFQHKKKRNGRQEPTPILGIPLFLLLDSDPSTWLIHGFSKCESYIPKLTLLLIAYLPCHVKKHVYHCDYAIRSQDDTFGQQNGINENRILMNPNAPLKFKNHIEKRRDAIALKNWDFIPKCRFPEKREFKCTRFVR